MHSVCVVGELRVIVNYLKVLRVAQQCFYGQLCSRQQCLIYWSVSERNYIPAIVNFFFLWCDTPPQWARASSFTSFLDHTQRRITVGRTPLDEWSARRRDLYLTTHNRQTSMPPVGFKPTISAGERTQTYALDRAAPGTGHFGLLPYFIYKSCTGTNGRL